MYTCTDGLPRIILTVLCKRTTSLQHVYRVNEVNTDQNRFYTRRGRIRLEQTCLIGSETL